MKKAEILGYNDFVGSIRLPADTKADIRRELQGFHRALRRLAKPILEDIDDTRKEIIGDQQDEVNEFVRLEQAGEHPDGMDEVKAAIEDFNAAYAKILDEDVEEEIPKVSPEAIAEAIPFSSRPEMSFAEIDAIFERFYKYD